MRAADDVRRRPSRLPFVSNAPYPSFLPYSSFSLLLFHLSELLDVVLPQYKRLEQSASNFKFKLSLDAKSELFDIFLRLQDWLHNLNNTARNVQRKEGGIAMCHSALLWSPKPYRVTHILGIWHFTFSDKGKIAKLVRESNAFFKESFKVAQGQNDWDFINNELTPCWETAKKALENFGGDKEEESQKKKEEMRQKLLEREKQRAAEKNGGGSKVENTEEARAAAEAAEKLLLEGEGDTKAKGKGKGGKNEIK